MTPFVGAILPGLMTEIEERRNEAKADFVADAEMYALRAWAYMREAKARMRSRRADTAKMVERKKVA